MKVDFAQNAESYGCRAWRVHDEQSLLAALAAARAHPGPTLLDIKVLPKTMTHDYASWWRTGDAQMAESPAVRRAAEQTLTQLKTPVSTEVESCRMALSLPGLRTMVNGRIRH